MATWKQIEASREARLWVTQVIAPTLIIVGSVLSVPEIRETVKTKVSEVKTKIKTKFKK